MTSITKNLSQSSMPSRTMPSPRRLSTYH
jgi:hypothetical protein